MGSGIKYIDDITKKAFKSFTKEASSWEDFYNKHGKSLKPNSNFVSNVTNLKKMSIAVAGFSIFTAGVLHYTSVPDTTVINKVEIVKRDVNNKKYNAKVVNITSEELNTKNQTKTKNNSNIAKEDIVIKVKVPIHKKVEVRKQVIINDSVN